MGYAWIALLISLSCVAPGFGDEVCFEGLGCFPNTNPYNNTEGTMPQNPSFVHATLRLFLQDGSSHPWQLLNKNNLESLSESQLDTTLPTRIIIHGFLQHGDVAWIRELAAELSQKQQTNVISVDWSHGAGFPYTQAVANTRVVGAEVARVVRYMINNLGMNRNGFHLIGHSLGAHVCGYVGRREPGLRRITGLDPARPGFIGTTPPVRLDPTDARFVDIIHTDGSRFETISGYGMLTPMGHIDFYPNGGQNQPGCSVSPVMNFLSTAVEEGMLSAENTVGCSHSRSIKLFIESINGDCEFTAFPCSNFDLFRNGSCMDCGNNKCPVMGYNAENFPRARGKYYLGTSGSPPYCGHHYHVTMKLSDNMPEIEGRIIIELVGRNGGSPPFDLNENSLNLRSGSSRDMMYIGRDDLGEILEVKVKFQEYDHMLGWLWSTNSINVNYTKVVFGSFGATWYFCGNNQMVGDGAKVTFDGPVHQLDNCVLV